MLYAAVTILSGQWADGGEGQQGSMALWLVARLACGVHVWRRPNWEVAAQWLVWFWVVAERWVWLLGGGGTIAWGEGIPMG